MQYAFIWDAARTAIGWYGSALAVVRDKDMAAVPTSERSARLAPRAIDDVVLGYANRAGEANRNGAGTATLLGALPTGVGGSPVDRLRGSGPDPVGRAARAIRAGNAGGTIARGMAGARLAMTVIEELQRGSGYNGCAMCVGVTRGRSPLNERV